MKLAIAEFLSGAFSLSLRAQGSGFTANRTWLLPSTLPTTGQVLQVVSISSTNVSLDFATVSGGGGGGTVSSVAIAAPVDTFVASGSPVTSSGTLSLSYSTQTANLVHASPASGGAGVPTWRSLVAADIPTLDAAKIGTGLIAIARLPVGTAINTIAAGNDARLHSQNTDVGTSNSSFQLNNLAAGLRIKDAAGVLQVRNATDTGFADLTCNNLTVLGANTIINTTELQVADPVITLNSSVTTGTPTLNAGIEALRGSQTRASLLWNESSTRWMAGVAGSEITLSRIVSRTFLSSDLVSGVLTFAHNLGTNNLVWQVYDDAGNAVFPDVISSSANSATFDFKSATVSNTWRVVVTG